MRATPNSATSSFSRFYSVCGIKAKVSRLLRHDDGSTVNRDTFQSSKSSPITGSRARPTADPLFITRFVQRFRPSEIYIPKYIYTIRVIRGDVSSSKSFTVDPRQRLSHITPGEELARCVRLNLQQEAFTGGIREKGN